MKVKVRTSMSDAELLVAAMNKKLGTQYTAYDYLAWESGQQTDGAEAFAKSVEQYVGKFPYAAVSFIARLRNRFVHALKRN